MRDPSLPPEANSTRAQELVTLAMESVGLINDVVAGAVTAHTEKRTPAQQISAVKRNYEHLEIMMAPDIYEVDEESISDNWFAETAETMSKATAMNDAITAGKNYYNSNS